MTVIADDNQPAPPPVDAETAPPPVDSAFRWTRETWGLALRATPLEALAQHLFTSSQLKLPAHGTEAERERAWLAVAASLSVERDRIFRVRQVHGSGVRVIVAGESASADPRALPDGDALVSNLPGAALLVVVADCVPLLLVDPRIGAAAAIHAGWRGTCAGVTSAAIAAMREAWGTRPEDLRAAIGPSIGPQDYEVGESLVEAFGRAGHGESAAGWFSRAGGGWHLDLWRANRDQLLAQGVAPERIFTAGLSTAAHPDWLESYRRDGAKAGRLVAGIVVPAAGSHGR